MMYSNIINNGIKRYENLYGKKPTSVKLNRKIYSKLEQENIKNEFTLSKIFDINIIQIMYKKIIFYNDNLKTEMRVNISEDFYEMNLR